MKKIYRISFVIIALILAVSVSSFAQQKKKPASKSSKSSRGGGSAYNYGIGLKVGDPIGITFKKYMGNNALEFILGRSAYADYAAGYYYDKHYKGYYYYGTGPYYNDPYHDPYRGPVTFQARYLVHKDLSQLLSGMKWYFGGGLQIRGSRYHYYYWYNNYLHEDTWTYIGVGPDLVLGAEYTFDGIPLSLALDVNLYMELFYRTFYPLGQGGLSIRYNF